MNIKILKRTISTLIVLSFVGAIAWHGTSNKELPDVALDTEAYAYDLPEVTITCDRLQKGCGLCFKKKDDSESGCVWSGKAKDSCECSTACSELGD